MVWRQCGEDSRQNWKWLRSERAAPRWEGRGWTVSGMSVSECVRFQREQTAHKSGGGTVKMSAEGKMGLERGEEEMQGCSE